jgi:hypothetical protein
MTITATEPMTADEARRITERIRTALDRFSTSWADLAERVGEAYERRADLALGYGSWAEYASAEFKPAEGLAASVRQQVVGLLSAQGMSVRAIAPVVGLGKSQVSEIRSQVSGHRTPETGRIATANGVVVAEVEHHDPRTECLSVIYRAWNARRAGKSLRLLRVSSPKGGIVPVPEPK